MDFKEFLEKVKTVENIPFEPEQLESIETEWNRVSNIADTAESKVTELETNLDESVKTITGLKTELYDVSRKLPSDSAGDQSTNQLDSSQSNTPKVVSLDDITKGIRGNLRW